MPEHSLIEGLDYYMENGLLVFTEQYLLTRGYCCCTGCRHCPYGYRRESDEKSNSTEGKKPQPPQANQP